MTEQLKKNEFNTNNVPPKAPGSKTPSTCFVKSAVKFLGGADAISKLKTTLKTEASKTTSEKANSRKAAAPRRRKCFSNYCKLVKTQQ